MLESYFTSLRYSEDFTREGKVGIARNVYVKDESPSSKKKGSDSDGGGSGKQPQQQQQQKVTIATAADGLNSLVQAAGIQIVSDAEGTRVQQYKCAMQMQPGSTGTTVVEAATTEARYSYEACAASNTPRSIEENVASAQAVVISKVEDGSTQCSETDFNNKVTGGDEPATGPHMTDLNTVLYSQSPGSSDGSEAVVQQQQQAVAFATTTGTGQEMLVHFNFTKDRDGFLRADDTTTLQRCDIPSAQVWPRQSGLPWSLMAVALCARVSSGVSPSPVTLITRRSAQRGVKRAAGQVVAWVGVNSVGGRGRWKVARELQQFNSIHIVGLGSMGVLLMVCVCDGDVVLACKVVVLAACRSSMAQIGEFLRMKTVNIVDGTLPTAVVEVAGTIARPCEECGKIFTTEEELESHAPCSQKGVVIDDKNGGSFACEICGKMFKRKEHLFQHRKLHTGERPYVCGVCSKAFSRKEHLVRHAVSHTGQKMHACDMCGKAFSRKDNLHKHRKTHGVAGPYVCETCGKSFVVKHYFLMHRGTHAGGGGEGEGGEDTTGVKTEEGAEVSDPLPYKCDQCDKAFAAKQYLANHKMRHRGKATAQAAQQVAQEEQVALTHSGAPALTTINNAALLAPNILHQVQTTTANTSPAAMIQVSTSSAGGTTYLCAPATVSANVPAPALCLITRALALAKVHWEGGGGPALTTVPRALPDVPQDSVLAERESYYPPTSPAPEHNTYHLRNTFHLLHLLQNQHVSSTSFASELPTRSAYFICSRTNMLHLLHLIQNQHVPPTSVCSRTNTFRLLRLIQNQHVPPTSSAPEPTRSTYFICSRTNMCHMMAMRLSIRILKLKYRIEKDPGGDEGEASSTRMRVGGGRSLRKPVDQHHCPARFPHAKIQGDLRQKLNLVYLGGRLLDELEHVVATQFVAYSHTSAGQRVRCGYDVSLVVTWPLGDACGNTLGLAASLELSCEQDCVVVV
ncbi:hypothetical protein PR048_024373 [Dryococelus australis]|uniref:C2H2-type domain-containing protein n=1 Tax=Dryococelus australis TaxID=614101 RepID=A0ABQ9GND7_9NEOP|nr:hypothetical protein PR048_024373 [Dryococelus australis]